MSILEIFSQKEGKSIGRFECSFDKLSDAFVSVSGHMGMSNPAVVTKYASKGIIIQKKKDGYILKLNMFNPPIELEWTGLDDLANLTKTLENIVDQNKKIAYFNQVNIQGKNFFQLAVNA